MTKKMIFEKEQENAFPCFHDFSITVLHSMSITTSRVFSSTQKRVLYLSLHSGATIGIKQQFTCDLHLFFVLVVLVSLPNLMTVPLASDINAIITQLLQWEQFNSAFCSQPQNNYSTISVNQGLS